MPRPAYMQGGTLRQYFCYSLQGDPAAISQNQVPFWERVRLDIIKKLTNTTGLRYTLFL